MAKNSQSSKNHDKKKENRVCEKIFRAFTSPARTVRRISSTTTKPDPVRVKFSETTTQAPKPITKMEPNKPVIARVDTTMKTDERFNDFISKAKLKIRAMTNLGDMMMETNDHETETSHGDHHRHVPVSHVHGEKSEKHFAEYIKKAKMKLRSSSTIAHSNSNYDSFNVVKD